MKLFELARKAGKDSKEVLTGLREAGIDLKSPISVIPPEHLAKATALFPEVAPAGRVVTVEKVPEAPHVDTPVVTVLKSRPIEVVPAEGMESRFNQYAIGIKRLKKDGKKSFSLLTFVFDPDTLEVKLLKEEPKRNEAAAILDMKMAMAKRKVV